MSRAVVLVDVLGDAHEVERRPRVAVDRGVDVGDGSIAEQRRRAARRPRRAASCGRSAGRTLTANVGTFVTSRRPVPVVDEAARRRDRLEDGPVARWRASANCCRSRSGGRTAEPSGSPTARRRRGRTRGTARGGRAGARPAVEVARSPVHPLLLDARSWIDDRERADDDGEDGVVDGAGKDGAERIGDGERRTEGAESDEQDHRVDVG